MEAIVMGYFKDARGEWHQPGNRDDFPDDEIEILETAGNVKRVRTAMSEPPATRRKNRRQ